MPAKELDWTAAMDRVGSFASAACFVHCLATPIFLSLFPVWVHFLPSEESTHRVLALSITLIGVFAFFTGYRRHKRSSVLVFLGVGMTFIFTGAFFGNRLPSHWMEVLITLAGSSCLIVAHCKNHTFCRRCERC
jgi:uncharacterized membrane protein YfcA